MKKTWSKDEVAQLYALPFNELMYRAQTVHREHFCADEVEMCTLLSVKTGACPEDCAYCPQSGHYHTGLAKEKLLDIRLVKHEARAARANGATRFCMGAAWRQPPAKELPKIIDMIKAVKEIGLETCMTLGMLSEEQSHALAEAGLDFYNHNLDTSPDYYHEIITTRTYDDRLKTLQHVRHAKMKVCCGGIVGMGESREDRIGLLCELANLPTPPESVPINRLIPIKGTPLESTPAIDNFEFIRTIAIARIMMPTSMVRLSAGRADMSDEMQSLCFMAGANSIWLGDRLLTAENPALDQDQALFQKLGLKAKPRTSTDCHVS